MGHNKTNKPRPGGRKTRLPLQKQPPPFVGILPALSNQIPSIYNVKYKDDHHKILGLKNGEPLEKFFELAQYKPTMLELYDPHIQHDVRSNKLTVASNDSTTIDIGPIFTTAEKLYPTLGAAAVWALHKMPMRIFTPLDFHNILVAYEWRGARTNKEFIENDLEENYPDEFEEYKITGEISEDTKDEIKCLLNADSGTTIMPDEFYQNMSPIFSQAKAPKNRYSSAAPPDITHAIHDINTHTKKFKKYGPFTSFDVDDTEDTAYYSAIIYEPTDICIIPHGFECKIQQEGKIILSPMHIDIEKAIKTTSVAEVVKDFLKFANLAEALITSLQKLMEKHNANRNNIAA